MQWESAGSNYRTMASGWRGKSPLAQSSSSQLPIASLQSLTSFSGFQRILQILVHDGFHNVGQAGKMTGLAQGPILTRADLS